VQGSRTSTATQMRTDGHSNLAADLNCKTFTSGERRYSRKQFGGWKRAGRFLQPKGSSCAPCSMLRRERPPKRGYKTLAACLRIFTVPAAVFTGIACRRIRAKPARSNAYAARIPNRVAPTEAQINIVKFKKSAIVPPWSTFSRSATCTIQGPKFLTDRESFLLLLLRLSQKTELH